MAARSGKTYAGAAPGGIRQAALLQVAERHCEEERQMMREQIELCAVGFLVLVLIALPDLVRWWQGVQP